MLSSAVAFMMFAGQASASKLIVAYVPNWVELDKYVSEIDYAKVTHINIAFENPLDSSGTMSFDPKNEVLIKRARASGVKILISIGGGSAASNKELQSRYFDLTSEAKRKGFVAKLSDYVVQNHFDGLDVDIEGPSIGKDYGPFIADLAKSLKSKGKLLTAALSQGYGGDQVPYSVFGLFDFVNVMAYDNTGPWGPDRAGQHSSMEQAKSTVAYWHERGLPLSKMVLGVPFYGYGFGKAFLEHGYSYKEILDKYPGSHLVDQVGETIWFNSIPTIKAKAQYVVDEGLAGVMIWSLDQDVKGELSLLSAIHSVFNRR
ncbi:MAG: glycosyl hydrolase family 18 protein [Fimbriimonas sp.]